MRQSVLSVHRRWRRGWLPIALFRAHRVHRLGKLIKARSRAWDPVAPMSAARLSDTRPDRDNPIMLTARLTFV